MNSSINTIACQENTEKKNAFLLQGGLPNKLTVSNLFEDFEVQDATTYFTLMADVCLGRTSEEILTHLFAHD